MDTSGCLVRVETSLFNYIQRRSAPSLSLKTGKRKSTWGTLHQQLQDSLKSSRQTKKILNPQDTLNLQFLQEV